MRTKDVEKKTGLSKQTIMYYEKEGLISPTRDENEYRNYSEEDVQVLLLTKLLRSMNIGMEDIKLVITNHRLLTIDILLAVFFIFHSSIFYNYFLLLNIFVRK